MAKNAKASAPKGDRPRLLVAAPTGEVFEHPTLEMAVENGLDVMRAAKNELIPVPPGWDLMAMPGTRPIGYDSEKGTFTTVETFTADFPDGTTRTFAPCAVAVHPPPGYVRLYHPAAVYLDTTHPDEKMRALGEERALLAASTTNASPVKPKASLAVLQDDASVIAPSSPMGGEDATRPGLPLWAYTAVGFTKSGPVAALFVADEVSRWKPELYYKAALPELIAARVAEDPENKILTQLAACAGDYLCCCAQNIFYERWEGAVPTAPACTAACLGCLSKDPEWGTPTPQKRLKFKPDPREISRVMIHHLERAPEAMVSFGQGCEGEPTMNGDVLVESVRLTRAATTKGLININTNGSRPEVVRRAADAGASVLRISINTFDREMYEAYYRPGDYSYDDVIRSLYVGRDKGMYLSINLLIWPGWTDRMAEIDAISKLVDDGALHMIQLRNLCVDPGYFRSVLPPREKRGILLGMRAFVDELHRRHPELRFGTFNPRLAAKWYEKIRPWVGARENA
jgi:pyruvate-formate lyase-activating enzyme